MMISAAGDFNAQSSVLSGKMVHGINIMRVLMPVRILFFIEFIPFQLVRNGNRTGANK